MKEQLEEDWLDARLREETPYLDDGGFTAQVIRKLPVRRAPNSMRATIIICVTLLASALTYALSDGGRFLISAANRLASMPLLFVCLLVICCSVLLTAVAAGAAIANAREQPFG